MAVADVKSGKIEFRTPEITFTGEGDPEWLALQLDKVLETIRVLARRAGEPQG